MPLKERVAILTAIKEVDRVITFNDLDNSAKDAILQARKDYPNCKIIFGNGGDRTKTNIPEMDLPEEHLPFVEFVFGVGGDDKKNSSSWILEKWKVPKTEKIWGNYSVLHENGKHTKVKELVVKPHESLSMQVHKHRAEHWFVSEGTASVYTLKNNQKELIGVYKKHDYLHIDVGQWHMLANESDSILKIIEIQYGENCIEEDIERRILK
jgi:mannose-6-phosphate isomerase-like protein (cupin superfamily)